MFFFFPVSFQPYASLHKPTISISIRVFNCPFDLPADAALLYSPHCCCPAVVFLFLCENKSIPIYPTATNGPFALRIPLPVPHQVIRINKKIDCVLSERKNIWSSFGSNEYASLAIDDRNKLTFFFQAIWKVAMHQLYTIFATFSRNFRMILHINRNTMQDIPYSAFRILKP